MQSSHWLGHTTVNSGYETVPMSCEVCDKRWIDILRTSIIRWANGTEEVKVIDETHCPVCGHTNQIKR
jgi:hypothetical protein